jgi:hypothetical protein
MTKPDYVCGLLAYDDIINIDKESQLTELQNMFGQVMFDLIYLKWKNNDCCLDINMKVVEIIKPPNLSKGRVIEVRFFNNQ